jgi:hypothetical protein
VGGSMLKYFAVDVPYRHDRAFSKRAHIIYILPTALKCTFHLNVQKFEVNDCIAKKPFNSNDLTHIFVPLLLLFCNHNPFERAL